MHMLVGFFFTGIAYLKNSDTSPAAFPTHVRRIWATLTQPLTIMARQTTPYSHTKSMHASTFEKMLAHTQPHSHACQTHMCSAPCRNHSTSWPDKQPHPYSCTKSMNTRSHRSEPARSTKLSLPLVTLCVCRLVASMMIEMMRWEREDSLFMAVEATCRRFWPDSMAASRSLQWITNDPKEHVSGHVKSDTSEMALRWPRAGACKEHIPTVTL